MSLHSTPSTDSIRTMNTAADPRPAVQLEGVSRRFGGTLALSDIDLALQPGRIHALVGQNGAGKSTCLGVIAGRIGATSGHVVVAGEDYGSTVTPQFALGAGVVAIYQELTLFPALTALENVFVGQLNGRGGWVRRKSLLGEYDALCERLGVRIPAEARVGSLSLADQQMLEIMRAVARRGRVLLLDEPTAALAPQEREALFRVMSDLREDGVCLVIVSHFLDEVLDIADTVTVFRDGRIAAPTTPAADWTVDTLVAAMLGRELEVLEESFMRQHAVSDSTEPILEVRGLSAGKLDNVALTVRPGEIVGIGGLVGSGRSTLLRALAGAQRATAGEIVFNGRRSGPFRSPRDAWSNGIAYIPEDRKTHGILKEMTGRDNIAVSDFSRVARSGFLSKRRMLALTSSLGAQFGLPEPMLDRPSGALSGGNQQKLLLGRAAVRAPRVLLADEATRGIDVGAKAQILRALRTLADSGMGVVLVSSDLEEIVAASDRIYVLHGGRVAAELDVTPDTVQDDILTPAFGLGKARHDHRD
jgi:ABC-type sugar transport system ATPase subunit